MPRSAHGTCYRTEFQLAMRHGRGMTTEASEIRNLRALHGYKTPDETRNLYFLTR
jgi:hypothetical protein